MSIIFVTQVTCVKNIQHKLYCMFRDDFHYFVTPKANAVTNFNSLRANKFLRDLAMIAVG